MGPREPAFVPARAPCLSLSRLFPDIEPSTITAVLNHTLRACDLYLLDPRLHEAEPTFVFNGLRSTFEPSSAKFKEYSTLDSIIFPLHNYFAILLVHHPSAYGLPVYLLSHLTHLQTLAADHEWDAVLRYHTLFFNRRVREMETDGSFTGWSAPAVDLLCVDIYPHRNSSRTIHPQSSASTAQHLSAPSTSPNRARRILPRRRRWRTRIPVHPNDGPRPCNASPIVMCLAWLQAKKP